MKLQLLKATALALLQVIAVQSADADVSEKSIKEVAANAATKLLTPTSNISVNDSRLNDCLDDCDRDGHTGNASRDCREDCEMEYGRKRPDGMPNRTPARRPNPRPPSNPTRKPTNRRPTRPPTRKPTRKPSPPTRRPTNRRPTRPPTRNPTRKPTKRPPTRPPTNKRPTVECEEVGESAAEFIVFDKVCVPTRSQSQSRPQYSPACRGVAINECEGQMTRKLERYCPDEYDEMNNREVLDLQNMCEDEVNDLTGGGGESSCTYYDVNDDTCRGKNFCSIEVGMCNSRVGKQDGSCMMIPEVCTREKDPVCGCDGRNYSNECAAYANGVNIRKYGSCR